MTSDAIHAPEALTWGLVEKVDAAEHLDTAVNAALDAILAPVDDVIRAQKRLCQMWKEAPLEASIRTSVDEFARSYKSSERGQRIAAFRKTCGKYRAALKAPPPGAGTGWFRPPSA